MKNDRLFCSTPIDDDFELLDLMVRDSSKIDDIYNSAISKGALGGKLLGAGGGGFFLFYVPQVKQKNFIKYFNKLIHIPFRFSSEGSKIMFKSRD